MNNRFYPVSISLFLILLIVACLRFFPELNQWLSSNDLIFGLVNFCSSLLGLFFLGKFLVVYFNRVSVIVSLLLIFLGTNLFAYSASISDFLHPVSFFLISLLLYKTSRFSLNESSSEKLIELALISALVVFINPINTIVAILLFTFNLQGLQHLKTRIIQLKTKDGLWLAISLFGIIQLLHLALNRTFYNSYLPFLSDDQQFFFNRPHVYAALLEYRKGWLIYTPVMFFSIIGLFHFFKRKLAGNHFFFTFLLFFGVITYIHFSWWNWWYGESFGQRVMIDYYPLLAIPLTAFIHTVQSSKSRVLKFWGVTGAIFFIYLNLFQTFQYKSGLLAKNNMSEELFWMMFGEKQKPSIYDCLLENPDYDLAKAEGKMGLKNNLCNGFVLRAGKLKEYRPSGTYYGIDGAILFTKETPVSIYYKTPQTASKFSVSLDENDVYLIAFYLKGELVQEVTLSNDANLPGLYVYEKSIENPGTDRVIINAIEGDRVFSVGHFFFR